MTSTQTESSSQQGTGTVRLHRVIKAPAERIYKAILDPAANCKWLPPYGFTCTVDHIDARVGGSYRMSFTNFSTGASQPFSGEYLELEPGKKIVATDKFDDPNLPGKMRTSYEFKEVSVGTEVNIVQENIPADIPEEACYLGWQESLEQLAKLVEPEIPDM
ncbi:MAG TPA: SRPBCC family protein [Fimbriimonadales bacterium]|jgi:uncharacterized protein YndB with AHSA1/START domain|nr:SRPBCC family protein [Fimbriimonadales bacterium]